MTVTDVMPIADRDSSDVLALAAAVEASSEHPIGQSIVAAARDDTYVRALACYFVLMTDAVVNE